MSHANIRIHLPGLGKRRPRAKERKIIIQRLRERDGEVCWICENPIDFSLPRDHDEAATIDHHMPSSRGGTNRFENLRLAHRCCNMRRQNAPRMEIK